MNSAITLAQLRQKPHWSYSSINGFVNICALQWAYRHVYGEPPLFTPSNLVFGKCFHRAAEYVTWLRKDGKAATSAETLTLFSDLLSQECRIAEPAVRLDEDETVDALHLQGRAMLKAWFDSADPDEKIVAVSQPFCVPLIDAEGDELERPLIGEFDCVIEKAGVPVVVDWKTSARRWPESKVRTDLQPTCYLYAQERLTGNVTQFRFDIVTKAKTPVVDKVPTTRQPDAFQRMIECVKVMESMVRQEHFLPSDQSFACAGCPWSLTCQAWHRNRHRSLYHLQLAA